MAARGEMPYTDGSTSRCGSFLAVGATTGGCTMAANEESGAERSTRLFSTYLKAADDGLSHDAVMLCEVIGDEIQSVSLRVAADPMKRMFAAE